MDLINSPNVQPGSPQLLKMTCPACFKLYSVEASALSFADGAPSLRFKCVVESCGTEFEARRSLATDAPILETFQISPRARARAPIEPVGLRPAAVRLCPKCGTSGSMNATDCGTCGIVFAKYKPAPESSVGEIRCENRRDIHDLWEQVLARYEDVALHERFVATCNDAGLLAFAAQKYSQILAASGYEEIARRMRSRIQGLATFGAERRRPARPVLFRIPRLVNLILFMAGALLTIGLMLPNMKSLVSVGIAAIALALGLRYFLRPTDGRP